MIVTRFAPSPTGLLHLGHAFAALTAHDAAKGGQFLLRIEDIDTGRSRDEFVDAIEEDLSWLGLAWEQPVRRQSQHFDDYVRALAALEVRGLTYPCFCTRKDIAEAADAPLGPEGALYPGTCRNMPADDRSARVAAGAQYAIRLNVHRAIERLPALTFEERGRGPDGETGVQTAHPETLGDVVLARKGLPTSYHLAVVVDDALQGVTLVTRGNDLFHATHVQRLLQELLGYAAPVYAHHRLILDANGKKFSKRDQSVTLRSLRESGTTPDGFRRMVGL